MEDLDGTNLSPDIATNVDGIGNASLLLLPLVSSATRTVNLPPTLPTDHDNYSQPPPQNDMHAGLLRDTLVIVGMFPTANFEEVYAHLEARRNEHHRLQNVVDDFLLGIPQHLSYEDYSQQLCNTVADIAAPVVMASRKRGANETNHDHSPPLSMPTTNKLQRLEVTATAAEVGAAIVNCEIAGGAPVTAPAEKLFLTVEPRVAGAFDVAGPAGSKAMMAGPASVTNVEQLQAGCSSTGAGGRECVAVLRQSLMDTFPDADPVYLEDVIKSCNGTEDGFQRAVHSLVEKSYPKLKDREERERRLALVNEFKVRQFSVDEILDWCENPLEFFYDQTKPVTESYKALVYVHLMNEYPKATPAEIKKILVTSNYHLAPAIRHVEQLFKSKPLVMAKRRGKRKAENFSGNPDIMFLRTLAFCRTEDHLRGSIAARVREREHRVTEGRRDGSLVVCLCCFDEDGLPEEMVECEGGHMFCKSCVERGIDVAFGQGKTRFDCMAENCSQTFSLSMLNTALKPKAFSNWIRKIQEDEILKANIPDLVQCPFCSFAAIVPNPEDKVFRCMNPDCLKESCRLCKGMSHIPLRCDEVEKELAVRFRTAIEDQMTEALVRKCNKCGRCFVKKDGCNKMTCPCGAHICYVCKQPIKGYDHFVRGACPQMNNTALMEADQVAAAAQKAKEVVTEKHPELRGVELKFDPTKTIDPRIPTRPAIAPNLFQRPLPAIAVPRMVVPLARGGDQMVVPLVEGLERMVAPLVRTPGRIVAPLVGGLGRMVAPLVGGIGRMVAPLVEGPGRMVAPLVRGRGRLATGPPRNGSHH